MGRRRRKKRKSSSSRKLSVALDWIEIALGDDGWGRGDPEPVLLLGLYALANDAVSLVSRGLARPRVRSPYPNDADGDDRPIIEARTPPGSRLALLVLALEEDGGKDVRELYAMLEKPSFTLWCDEDPEPNPRAIGEWIAGPSGTFGAHPLHGEVDLAESCRSDEWIGATLIVGVARGSQHRVHVRSAEGDNDWTIELALR